MTDIKKAKHKLTFAQLAALGFLLLIVAGTLLLMLPLASNGRGATFTEAFFTATSATCVTGLIVADTFTQWSLFGQLVIITLIQIGGLGFMTIMAMFSFLFGSKIGLRSRELLKNSMSVQQLGGVVKLIKKVLIGTAIFEGAGAVILSSRFIPVFGWGRGIYYGIFHSVSAFCNAGFDLMGILEPNSSFTLFTQDSVIMITLSLLILIGGIGFFVWDDVSKNKLHIKRYKLHSKIVLLVTLSLTVVGTVIILLLEYGGALSELSFFDKLCVSLFSSVTPRTAGFNALDASALHTGSIMLTILYMMIGGSPGSTAGGIKTSTIAVLFVTAWASIRNSRSDNIYGRRLDEKAAKRAVTVLSVYFAILVFGIMALCIDNPGTDLTSIVYEAVSAESTVGMTVGITAGLGTFSRWILIMLMYLGRVGSVSFIMVFTERKAPAPVLLPEENVNIG